MRVNHEIPLYGLKWPKELTPFFTSTNTWSLFLKSHLASPYIRTVSPDSGQRGDLRHSNQTWSWVHEFSSVYIDKYSILTQHIWKGAVTDFLRLRGTCHSQNTSRSLNVKVPLLKFKILHFQNIIYVCHQCVEFYYKSHQNMQVSFTHYSYILIV